MRDQDSEAVLRNMRHPSCIVMPCTECRALNAAIAALQSQQDGAQGGDAVAEIFVSEESIDLCRTGRRDSQFGDDDALRDHLGIGLHSLYTRPAIAPQGAWQRAIEEVDAAELFSDGLAGDLRSAGIDTIESAYMEGRKNAIQEVRDVAKEKAIAPQATPAAVDDAIAEMRSLEADLRKDGMHSHANTYEHCIGIVEAAIRPREITTDLIRIAGEAYAKFLRKRHGAGRYNEDAMRAALTAALAAPPAEAPVGAVPQGVVTVDSVAMGTRLAELLAALASQAARMGELEALLAEALPYIHDEHPSLRPYAKQLHQRVSAAIDKLRGEAGHG